LSWDAVLGQQPAKKFIRAALESGRAPHGYLFEGASGVGKKTAARMLAQTLLCEQGGSEACGQCKSCHMFEQGAGLQNGHPDVLLPVKCDASGQPTDKLVKDQENILPLPTMQYLCEQLHRSPVMGRKRIAIVPEAQRMCRGQAEAANAFLKTLEEPPASSIVILTTCQPDALLETIISRVQPVRFRRLNREEMKTGLQQHAERTKQKLPAAQELDLAIGLSDGSLGRALELIEGDLKKWRESVWKELSGFGPQSSPRFGLSLWKIAEDEGQRLFEGSEDAEEEAAEEEEEENEESEATRKTAAGWKRYVFQRELELCEAAFRDALLSSSGAEASLPNVPEARALASKLGQRFGMEGCERVIMALGESQRALKLYINGSLIARVLAGKMVDAIARS
jgi:DNA polymerase III delta prime subunit